MHDRRKSLENDRSFELRPEDAVDDKEHKLLLVKLVLLLLFPVVKKDGGGGADLDEEVSEGGGGISSESSDGRLKDGTWEITSLSWTRSCSSSSNLERLLGMHLLIQAPI